MSYLTPYKTLNDLDSIFDLFFDHTQNQTCRHKIELKEEEDSLFISAELPGYSKDQISIEYKDEILSITAEKKDQKENAIIKNVSVGKINFTKTKAALENGILEIELPKHEEEKPQRLEIK